MQRGSQVVEDKTPIIYKGPRTIQGLWDKKFYDIRSVKQQTSRIMRCRPIFEEWEAKFSVSFFDPDVLNDGDILHFLQQAGRRSPRGFSASFRKIRGGVMSDGDVTLHPAYKEALKLMSEAGLEYGKVFEHDWLAMALG